jgi:hypothetical protein
LSPQIAVRQKTAVPSLMFLLRTVHRLHAQMEPLDHHAAARVVATSSVATAMTVRRSTDTISMTLRLSDIFYEQVAVRILSPCRDACHKFLPGPFPVAPPTTPLSMLSVARALSPSTSRTIWSGLHHISLLAQGTQLCFLSGWHTSIRKL